MFYTMSCNIILGAIIFLSTSSVFAGDLKPYTYRCDDGRKFTITFIKEKGDKFPLKARLVFSNSKTVEILELQQTGSGVSYANEKYNYLEHHGDVMLVNFTKKPQKGNNDYQMSCQEVK